MVSGLELRVFVRQRHVLRYKKYGHQLCEGQREYKTASLRNPAIPDPQFQPPWLPHLKVNPLIDRTNFPQPLDGLGLFCLHPKGPGTYKVHTWGPKGVPIWLYWPKVYTIQVPGPFAETTWSRVAAEEQVQVFSSRMPPEGSGASAEQALRLMFWDCNGCRV